MPVDRHEEGVNWSLVVKRAALWAASRLPRQVWRGQRNGHPPGAEQVEDLVQDAVARALERKREWTIGTSPDERLLTNIIRSRISHRIARLAELEENKNTSLEDRIDKNPDSRELSTEPESTSPYGPMRGSLLSAEFHYYQGQIEQRARRSLASDEDGQAVLGHLLDGTTRPHIIAQAMGRTQREVDNIKKRVSHKLENEFQDLRQLYGLSSPRRRQKGGGE
jgi:DNA-directed RNA polymerase specialized sigma24 family protein